MRTLDITCTNGRQFIMAEDQPRILTHGDRLNIQVDPIREVIAKFTHVASGVSVNWAWYNERQGVVQWTFQNRDSAEHSVILLRNGYYFAGAFWPVYYANSDGRGASASNPNDDFGTSFLNGSSNVGPLASKGVAANDPPLALVTFDNNNAAAVSSTNSQVLFVFTLAPGASWSMLEAGFSATMKPEDISLYELTPLNGGDFCIGYDQKRVSDWDSQTTTTLQGYSPDPNTFNTWLLSAEAGAPFKELPYSDTYSDGKCTNVG